VINYYNYKIYKKKKKIVDDELHINPSLI